jgi:hypothetical protein
VVVGKVIDIGALELEGANALYFKLSFLQAFFGKDSDGFVGCLGEDLVNTCRR